MTKVLILTVFFITRQRMGPTFAILKQTFSTSPSIGKFYFVLTIQFFFCSMATSSSNGSDYYVLLMITDGVISDMDATKEAIVIAARLPISIIIVGVGPAEFDGKSFMKSFIWSCI